MYTNINLKAGALQYYIHQIQKKQDLLNSSDRRRAHVSTKELILVQPCKCKQNVFTKQFEFSFSEHIAKLNNDILRS